MSPIGWDRELRKRRGSAERLGGLEVFYDFNWREMFRHNRSAFPHGKSLASLVRVDCPEGKQPTLLLTEREDVQPGIITTDDRYIVVVPIRDYLAKAGADAASTFYARVSNAPLTRLSGLRSIDFSQIELRQFLENHLDEESLTQWVRTSPERLATLMRLARTLEASAEPDLINVLPQLATIGPEILTEIAQLVERTGGTEYIRRLFDILTGSAKGRHLAVEALSEKLEDRLNDISSEIEQYERLIKDPAAREADVHSFLARSPWIVGVTYVRARSKVEIPRGEVDFILDRHDGFFDIVELKGPAEPIIEQSRPDDDRPASASAYALSSSLAQALAQAHHYRSILERSSDIAEQFGLSDTRQPRIIIVLGRSSTLTETGREILRHLNLSLHRVEVIPYDILAKRTAGIVDNVKALIQRADEITI